MRSTLNAALLPLPLLLLLLIPLASCSTQPIDVTVDLLTDWAPGLDFVTANVEVSRTSFDGPRGDEVRQTSLTVTGTENFIEGVRIADLTAIGAGRRFLRISLRSAGGVPIAQRVLDLTLDESFAAVVLLTRSCDSVECPAPAGTPELSECQAGECVDPRCSPSTPEYCDITPCAGDDECLLGLPWCEGDAFCRAGGCLCRDEAPPVDGGVPMDSGPGCADAEVACNDGADEDCDGLTDCADSDCLGGSCDDGYYCTTNDRCGADGACSETEATCADGLCNEESGDCVACLADSDCGAVSGDWGACGGFSGTCDQGGTRSRTLTTPTCTAGACTYPTSPETEACTRSTNGTGCGSTAGSWGGCVRSDTCGTAGTQRRTITAMVCSGGSCGAGGTRSETRACTLGAAPNGTLCGSFWDTCCGGVCQNLRFNPNHCGACGVSCAAIGTSCVNAAGLGYSCTCVSNASCKTEVGPAATCYAYGGQTLCNCQCPLNNVACADGGCGPGFFCHDCTGHNYCAAFNNGC